MISYHVSYTSGLRRHHHGNKIGQPKMVVRIQLVQAGPLKDHQGTLRILFDAGLLATVPTLPLSGEKGSQDSDSFRKVC